MIRKKNIKLSKYDSLVIFKKKIRDLDYILLPTELHLKNVYYLYSACSNRTNVVLVIVLRMIIGKGA